MTAQIQHVAKAIAALVTPLIVAGLANVVGLDAGAVELLVTSLVTAGLVWAIPNRS